MMTAKFAALIFFSLHAVFASNQGLVPPRYVVNLDVAPKLRWAKVAADYKKYTPEIIEVLKQYIPADQMKTAAIIGQQLGKDLDQEINDELKGFARIGGIAHGYLVLLNLLYDFSAHANGGFKACTSIIAKDGSGNLFHARNLDYSFTDLLRNVTISVDFQQGGKTIYTTTTFAYYNGAMNGQRPRAFTISIDERDQGPFWKNILVMAATGLRNPLGYAVRKTLQTATNYDEAIQIMSKVDLAAPCYVIIGGVRPYQGIVITRNRLNTADRWTMNKAIGGWYLVQTNDDHWGPPLDDRRLAAEKSMNETGQGKIDPKTLFQVLSTPPVFRSVTVYTIVMQAAKPNLYYQTARIRTDFESS